MNTPSLLTDNNLPKVYVSIFSYYGYDYVEKVKFFQEDDDYNNDHTANHRAITLI